jgi:hypothetical protein
MVPRCTGLKPQRAFSEPLCVALGLVTNWGNACCLGKAHDRHNQPNTDLRSPCDGRHRSTRPCVHRANPPSPCRLKRAGSEKRHGRRGFADPIAATQPAPATADSPADSARAARGILATAPVNRPSGFCKIGRVSDEAPRYHARRRIFLPRHGGGGIFESKINNLANELPLSVAARALAATTMLASAVRA